jgi:hypothetical protein
MAEIGVAVALITIEAPEKCTMRPVQSAERHVKFPSSPMAPGLYIAAIAIRSISQPGRPEDTNSKIIAQSDCLN